MGLSYSFKRRESEYEYRGNTKTLSLFINLVILLIRKFDDDYEVNIYYYIINKMQEILLYL